LVWNWAHRPHRGFTSTRTTPLAPWPNCDEPTRWRGTHGKSASKRKCGYRAHAIDFGCRAVYARAKACKRSIVAHGIALFLEISCDGQSNGAVCIRPTSPKTSRRSMGRRWPRTTRMTRSLAMSAKSDVAWHVRRCSETVKYSGSCGPAKQRRVALSPLNPGVTFRERPAQLSSGRRMLVDRK